MTSASSAAPTATGRRRRAFSSSSGAHLRGVAAAEGLLQGIQRGEALVEEEEPEQARGLGVLVDVAPGLDVVQVPLDGHRPEVELAVELPVVADEILGLEAPGHERGLPEALL